VGTQGEETMNDRILEWLRLEHDATELRTDRVIAAMLEMDRDDVRLGLSVLKREGKVLYQWIDGQQAWFAPKRGFVEGPKLPP
jgi:hypothetical protein